MADASTIPAKPRSAGGGLYLSLRLRLALLVLVGVLPLLGFSLMGEYLNYRATAERTGRETLAKARSLSEAIDAELQARINVLQALATSARLLSGEIEGFRDRVEAVIARQYPGANIVLLEADGRQLMNLAVPRGARLPARPHVETIRKVFASGRPAVSDLYFGAALQRLVVSIDVPVFDPKGDVVAVLSMVPAPGTFDDLIRRHAREASAIVALFDAQHTMIARSRNPEHYIGHKAGMRLRSRMQSDRDGILADGVSREGIPVMAVFSRSGTFGWTVVIGVRRTDLTEPALASAARALAFAAMLLLIGLLLASLVSRRISGPIAALGGLAAATAGNAALPGTATGLRETDRVADALRAAHERRLRSEQRFRTLFEANPLAMCVYDLGSLRLLEVNQAAVTQYGWSRAELLAMTVADLYAPEHRALPLERARERRRGLFIAPQRRKDGSRFEIEAMVRIVELDGRRVALATSHDITQRKAMEEQLRQAQKMETFGQIAGGVAHDFNNSLAVVMGCLEEILDDTVGDEGVHASADTAMHATQQAAALTARLLAFSRRQELTPAELDVGAAIAGLHKILRSAVPPAIELTLRAAPSGARSVLDLTQLETTVMNLVVNARDAIDGAGMIEVAVSRRVVTADEASAQPALRAGDWVVVSVRDDGPGMTDAVRIRIFEPYFTTKDVGKGTGLGLSQVHGFVAQSGGFVTVDSTPGAGTHIALHFPATA